MANQANPSVRRALISVSDKTGIVDFGRALTERGVELLSTGGTYRLLKENSIPVTEVSDYTGFPEMMDGRVKTLHPKIHGGILGRRGTDDAVMSEHGISPIDMVVVNLYPFEATVAKGAERDEIIERQRAEMMELSTPVVQLWERVLTIPLIGTLDSMRAQEVMENLLNSIVEHSAEVVIVAITGVRVVDTQVAQHLLRTAAAVRLMGARCIISGISPKIAQTMVELGVDVGEVRTRSSLRSALMDALTSVGVAIRPINDDKRNAK